MTVFPRHRQNGAVLIVALVMLLVLTLLAVSSMRGVTLETRITANRAQTVQLVNVAEAGLREAEFRFYGPGNLADKLNVNAANCATS
ncbi:PilX N-terminal domain-containing pilus assembly protein, partial [Pseudomonas sihuiensis]